MSHAAHHKGQVLVLTAGRSPYPKIINGSVKATLVRPVAVDLFK
jgi:uncharacterized damage-inducible protein DinB